MELKTQALDRVLEALSPALAAELDRVVSETREALEQEFQKRLQSAVREAESASRQAAEAEQEQAVREARETTKNQVTEELNEQFKKTLEQATSALKSEASTELARVQEQLDQFRIFADAQKLLVYVAKTDGLALWKTRGKAAFPEIISQQTTDPEFYFKIVTVRGKKVAAACAAQPYKTEALDFLVLTMERAIEVFGLRLRAPMQLLRHPSHRHQCPRRPVLRRPLPQQHPQMNPPVRSTF